MQFYWKCEECDETNAYPSVKICETCGSPMTPAAEQRVLREQKEEEKRQAQIKKEQERKRREALRAQQEAERKRQEALKAAQQAEEERKRREQLERALKQKEEREKKFASVLRKCTSFSSGFMRTFAVIAVVVTVVLLIKNADNVNLGKSFDRISSNIHTEYLAHTIVEPNNSTHDNVDVEADSSDEEFDVSEKRVSRVFNKVGIQFSSLFEGVSSNIENQFGYLKDTFKPGENISALVEDIVEYISGGVDK